MLMTTASLNNSPNSDNGEVKMRLTKRELTLIIEELEVNEDTYIHMVKEELEKGNKPVPQSRPLEVLNLLNKLRGIQKQLQNSST